MSSDHHPTGLSGEQISALLDGELDESLVAGACSAWRDRPEARSTWHAYHLIGDVMRSEDLASDAVRDAAFLKALRGRLALEPVVLAPSAVVAASSAGRADGFARASRRSWRAPAAVAAGFMVVAGALVVTREPSVQPPAQAGRQLAAAPLTSPSPVALSLSATRPAVSVVSVSETTPEPEFLVANGKLIRDARLDRYLSAHKQFAGSSALGVPSAFLRSATADMSNR